MRLGLVLGYEHQRGYRPSEGGYLIEENVFRNTDNGIRVGLSSPEPTVIRHNTFVDTFHAVSAGGSNIHILDNTILAPAPGQVPGQGYPSIAIGIIAINPVKGTREPPYGRCDDNIIAGNVIDGYPSGISLGARPGTGCHRNTIRDNTVFIRPVVIQQSLDHSTDRDKTSFIFFGIPISVSAPDMGGQTRQPRGQSDRGQPDTRC